MKDVSVIAIYGRSRIHVLFYSYLLGLLFLNVIPFSEKTSIILSGNKLVFRLDYLLHVILLLGFAWIYVWSRIKREVIFRDRETFLVIAISLIAAFCLEGIQYFLPYRRFNPLDLLSNLIGVTISSFFIMLSNRLSLTR